MVFQSLPVVSKCPVFPHQKSTLTDLKISISDLPMLSCHYIQKGVLLTRPPFPIIDLLKCGLSEALSHFPPLPGRLATDSNGYVYIVCNDAGVDFTHADGSRICVRDLLESVDGDVSEIAKKIFSFDGRVSYEGHSGPTLAVQVTELAECVFVGCAVNHAVTDRMPYWNFFNMFAEMSRDVGTISRALDFSRASVLISPVVQRLRPPWRYSVVGLR